MSLIMWDQKSYKRWWTRGKILIAGFSEDCELSLRDLNKMAGLLKTAED